MVETGNDLMMSRHSDQRITALTSGKCGNTRQQSSFLISGTVSAIHAVDAVSSAKSDLASLFLKGSISAAQLYTAARNACAAITNVICRYQPCQLRTSYGQDPLHLWLSRSILPRSSACRLAICGYRSVVFHWYWYSYRHLVCSRENILQKTKRGWS